MILPGQEICARGLVHPILRRTVLNGCTYGLGAASYDVRVEFDDAGRVEEYLLEPGEFILAATMEQFNMPNDVAATVYDKSSLVRRGMTVHNTFIDPGWRGYLTLEITNNGREMIHLRRGQGIAQVVFQKLLYPADEPYNGKYQDQGRGPQEAR